MSREEHVKRRINELRELIRMTECRIQELEWYLDLNVDDEPSP